MAKVFFHRALPVGRMVIWPRHDVGIGVDYGFADVARRVRRRAVIVRRLDDSGGFCSDIAEIRAYHAAREWMRVVVT